MRKHLIMSLMALATAGLVFTSCSDDENNTPEKTAQYAVALDMPLNLDNAKLESATATLTNVSTKKTYTAQNFRLSGTQYADTLTLPEGTYNIEVEGTVSYDLQKSTTDDETTVATRTTRGVKATRENVAVSASSTAAADPLALSVYVAQSGLVISEIFFTGTLTAEGKQYSDDQYFKVANNSDTTMYLDGVGFAESAFLTVDKQDYKPNIMDEAVSIDALYIFPGSGKDYPIKPGQEVIVAVNAVNHKEYNPLSFDLSKADFEIYDESSNPKFTDTQNPDVPDMVNWYDYSATYFGMHNRGFKSYFLVKPEVDKDKFLSDYAYTYTYVFTYGEYSFDMDGDAFKVPNSWVLDAVNLSIADMFEWLVTSPALDAGWAHCGSVDRDQTRYGKSVIRKKNGTKWVDTNNSTNDFESDAKASLLD